MRDEEENVMMVQLLKQSAGLRIVFGIHAALTFAAFVVLVVRPTAIPGRVGIHLEPPAYLVCRLLAAAELGLSVISWGARTITDVKALRLIITTFIVFHSASGLLEIYAFTKGLSPAIWANVGLRMVVVALFVWYGKSLAQHG
jgi:hypothetical protein